MAANGDPFPPREAESLFTRPFSLWPLAFSLPAFSIRPLAFSLGKACSQIRTTRQACQPVETD
jgi:hypothetical protein